jgi:hypothetical protein
VRRERHLIAALQLLGVGKLDQNRNARIDSEPFGQHLRSGRRLIVVDQLVGAIKDRINPATFRSEGANPRQQCDDATSFHRERPIFRPSAQCLPVTPKKPPPDKPQRSSGRPPRATPPEPAALEGVNGKRE